MKDRIMDIIIALLTILKMLGLGLLFFILIGIGIALLPILILAYILFDFNYAKWVDDEIIDLFNF